MGCGSIRIRGLATFRRSRVTRRTGDLPPNESRDRPVVILHALAVDAQPDEAVTGAVARVSIVDTLVAVRYAQDATKWAAGFRGIGRRL